MAWEIQKNSFRIMKMKGVPLTLLAEFFQEIEDMRAQGGTKPVEEANA